jgi:radical SAM protein with 4Fe4S-binding SPASM domain
MNNVQILAKENLNIIIKSMCLKQNKEEIVGIKKWAESLLGRPAGNRYRFKCGPMIFPRLDGDNAPLAFRLTPEESLALKKKDVDFWNEYQRGIEAGFPRLKRDKEFLYHCDSWLEQFFINPYGRLKFCEFSDKYSVDLKTESFQKAFYKISPRLLQEKFKTDSPCRECHLRPICYYCPARAYLETGNEEGPVGYYCALSKALQGQERML